MVFHWILCQTCTKLKALLVFIWHISLKQCLHLIILSSNSYQGILLQIEVKVDTWINAIHCRNKKYDKSIVLRSFCRIYVPALNVDLRASSMDFNPEFGMYNYEKYNCCRSCNDITAKCKEPWKLKMTHFISMSQVYKV